MRTLAFIALMVVGLAGCLDSFDNDRLFVEAPTVDAATVVNDLQSFVEAHGERADNLPPHLSARDAIAQSFADAGLEVWRQNFTNGIYQENIVGIKWGQQRDAWVVVGSHYDIATRDCNQIPDGISLPVIGDVERPDVIPCGHRPFSQGAYDDGSGTLMTMHLAQAFADLETYYTIAFVAFDGEERGLEGSSNFTETIVSGTHPYGDVQFRGMVNLDMIGLNWPGVDAPIYMDSNSPELETKVLETMLKIGMPEDQIKFQGITLGRSDYHWFFELGVPTAFFISDFEEWQLPGDTPVTTQCVQLPTGNVQCSAYPFWHVEDTYETMLQMAGSQEDLEAGFQTALDLASGQIAFLASETSVTLKAAE